MNTEILTVRDLSIDNLDKLRNASKVIKRGGLVVFPTETVYGIGADATNASAVKKIFEAKGRPSDNPLIIHVASPHEAEDYSYTTPLFYKLAERFMPGPLTVIMKSKDTIPLTTRGGLDTVAVRCPESEIAREFIKLCGVPIAAPSANVSGSPSTTSVQHVIEDMNGRVDVIIDGGECDFGLESTIVKIEDNSLILLRPGKITPEELSELATLKIAPSVLDKLAEGERALSPGMKYRHYAPKSPVILLDGDLESVVKFIKEKNESNTALICYSEDVDFCRRELPTCDIYDFGGSDDKETQAHRLFSILRDTDARNYSVIYAPLPAKEGISLALYNRMIRAAAHTIIRL